MRALFYLGPRKLEMREIAEPNGDVVIRVIDAGICGTDLKTYLKGHPMFKPPIILGHECYGKVVALNNYSGSLKLGSLVAIAPYAECGECDECKRGTPELCKNKTYVETGCFTQQISLSKEHASKALFEIDDDFVQILAEPLACVLNGFQKLVPKPRNLLIVGGGPMGVLFALLGISEGCDVFVVEKSDWRIQHIRSMGINVGYEPPESTFDGVVLAVNIPELVKLYMPYTNDGGNLLLFSGFPKSSNIEIDPYAVHYREVNIIGSFGFGIKHFKKAVEILASKPELFSKLITHTFPLEKAQEAFDLLEEKKAMKIVLGCE